jgi:hypothetical protein
MKLDMYLNLLEYKEAGPSPASKTNFIFPYDKNIHLQKNMFSNNSQAI